MRANTLPAVALLLVATACCTGTRSRAKALLEGAALPGNVEIQLTEDVQLFTHTRTITIRGDGHTLVEYRSKTSGAIEEAATRAVEPKVVTTLINEMFEAGFEEMPSAYSGERHQIQRSRDGGYQPLIMVTTDGACNSMRLRIGDWHKTVQECNGAPEPLRRLYRKLIEAAGEKDMR